MTELPDSDSSPRPTPLASIHAELGGRMTDFAGWEMPLRYGSALDEHHAVRNAVGLFDLSHMGEIDLVGPGAAAAADHTFIGWLSKLAIGQARYTMICNPAGGIIDDLIVYRRGDDHFTVVANASNTTAVVAEVEARASGFDTTVINRSQELALIALQGPGATAIMGELLRRQPDDAAAVAALRYYRCVDVRIGDVDALIARTGYTGEDGFEIYVANDAAVDTWRSLADLGQPHGLVPCGLACRDTLRLEAGMALYGNELSIDLTPFDVGAGRMIKFDKPDDFVGRAALEAAADTPHRALVGLDVSGKRPARSGYAVLDADGQPVGSVTSGTLSPTLNRLIAMASLDPGAPTEGLHIDVRGDATAAAVIELPFYRRD